MAISDVAHRWQRSGIGVYTKGLLLALAAAPNAPTILPFLEAAAPVVARDRSCTGVERWKMRLLRRGLGRLEWWLPRADMIHFTDVQSVPAGVPVASTVHDLTMFRLPALFPEEYRDTSTTLMYQRATRATVRRARVFICVSEQTRDDLCELFPESSERAVVVRSGVRKPPPGFARAPGDPPRILHVGRIEHRKNLRSVLVALQGLARAGERFIFDVVGSEVSHGATEIIEYARACDPDKAWIRIHGEVTDDELWHLMERATVLVAPSLYEGFDFPPLEALSAGLPVIASDTPVHREILAGLAGLVPPTRIEGWRELLHVAIREPKTLDAGHAKAVLSQRGVDWDQCVQGTLKAYARCLS